MTMMVARRPRPRHPPLAAFSARLTVFTAAQFSSSGTPLSSNLLHVLRERIDCGDLHADVAQERAARRLDRLQEALVGYSNEALLLEPEIKEKQSDDHMEETNSREQDNGHTPRLLEPSLKEIETQKEETLGTDQTKPSIPTIRIPRGLFLHGQVGTGKSMLMDLFFQHTDVDRKRRVHFHSFLQDVHQRIHRLKQSDLKTRGRDFHVDTSIHRNPIARVARELASETTLLCFDEFQVTDVADALIMKQLFEHCFRYGTVMVATSNRPPEDLYEGGLNRSYFLPFIDLLYQHCIVHEIKSETDYRKLLSRDMDQCFLVDDGDFSDSQRLCDSAFDRLLEGNEAVSMDLSVGFNRTVTAPQAHPQGVIGRFRFDDLCNRELGSSDYRAIADQFSIVMLERIPLLTLKEHDQARRFITLVDELYEGRCALFCSAVAGPERLFIGHDSNNREQPLEPDSIETKAGETFGIDVAQSTGRTVGELASVRELSFAFRRAASRLTEMCSKQWWDRRLTEFP